MPASIPPVRPHPAKPFRTLKDAADAGQIIKLRCGCCHRQVNYLATDLVKVLNPDLPLNLPPFECSRCKTREYMDVRACTPPPASEGDYYLRRLVGVRRTAVWEDKLVAHRRDR